MFLICRRRRRCCFDKSETSETKTQNTLTFSIHVYIVYIEGWCIACHQTDRAQQDSVYTHYRGWTHPVWRRRQVFSGLIITAIIVVCRADIIDGWFYARGKFVYFFNARMLVFCCWLISRWVGKHVCWFFAWIVVCSGDIGNCVYWPTFDVHFCFVFRSMIVTR